MFCETVTFAKVFAFYKLLKTSGDPVLKGINIMREHLQNNFTQKPASAFDVATQNLILRDAAPVSLNNRLDALKVLSHSILQEINSLRQDENAVLLLKIDLSHEVQRFEKDLIRCALLRTGGKQRQAARLLNVKVSTLNAKIKRFNIAANGLSQLAE